MAGWRRGILVVGMVTLLLPGTAGARGGFGVRLGRWSPVPENAWANRSHALYIGFARYEIVRRLWLQGEAAYWRGASNQAVGDDGTIYGQYRETLFMPSAELVYSLPVGRRFHVSAAGGVGAHRWDHLVGQWCAAADAGSGSNAPVRVGYVAFSELSWHMTRAVSLDAELRVFHGDHPAPSCIGPGYDAHPYTRWTTGALGLTVWP